MSLGAIDAYIPAVFLLILGALVVVGTLLVGRVVRPALPNPKKLSAYECGEDTVGDAWSLFNIRFYVIGLIFIIFEVESALMFPVAAVYKKFNEMGLGGLALVEVLIFITVLVSGLAYCWRKGDLDWVKSFQVSEKKR